MVAGTIKLRQRMGAPADLVKRAPSFGGVWVTSPGSRGDGMEHDRLPVASSDARNEDNLPTTALGARCSEEMHRFLRQEPSTERCCLILFRRALADHDDDAWAALHT